MPAGTVEGEHQLTPTALAQRRIGNTAFELADELRRATRCQQRIGPILHKCGMALDPPRLFGCSAVAVGQFGDSAPEGQGFFEAGHRLSCVPSGRSVPPQPGSRLVPGGVDFGLDQLPTRSLG